MIRALRSPVSALAVLAVASVACNDEPSFNEPGPGDFVQATQPAAGEVLTADDFARRGAVAIALNFFAAEGRFGFGALQSFRIDGEDVREAVEIITQDGSPPRRAALSFPQPQLDEGRHEVEVVYSDSRGTLHRVRWSFTIQG